MLARTLTKNSGMQILTKIFGSKLWLGYSFFCPVKSVQKRILYHPIAFEDVVWYISRNMKQELKNSPLGGAPVFSASRHTKFHLFFTICMVKFWYNVELFG